MLELSAIFYSLYTTLSEKGNFSPHPSAHFTPPVVHMATSLLPYLCLSVSLSVCHIAALPE